MKGKTKILGVGLSLMLLTSLLAFATPVSAGTLSWSDEDIPSTDGKVIQLGSDVTDIAVAGEGTTIYAASSVAELGIAASRKGIMPVWSDDQASSGTYSVKMDVVKAEMAYDYGAEVILPSPFDTVSATLASTSFMVYAATTGDYIGWNDSTKEAKAPYMQWTVDLGKEYEGSRYASLVPPSVSIPEGAGDWYEATPSAGDWYLWSWTPGYLITSGSLDAIHTFLSDPNNYPDYEVTLFKIQYGYASSSDMTPDTGTVYVDDVTINGITYDLEPALVYRSTDAGESWSALSRPADVSSFTSIAVAPDDENFIGVITEDNKVYVSKSAGSSWDELPFEAAEAPDALHDIAIAPETSSRYIAVAGEKSVDGKVWYWKIGAVSPAWVDITDSVDYPGFAEATVAAALAFSPNFASDEVMVAVTADTDGSPDTVDFQIFSFNQDCWNEAAAFAGYPVSLEANEDFTLDSASISLAPDYLGSDDVMRLAFVGLAAGADKETSSLQRLDDDRATVLKDEVQIHSVAFDGSNLVAGRFDATTVYRCDDPLASSPSVKGSSSTKNPGGQSRVVVAWADTDVVAGTSGDESAFAVSRNNGKSFNDISLIDTSLANITDVAVSADGTVVYMATDDGADLSLWRYASSWERVLSRQGKDDFIVRLAPEDADVVYVAEKGGTTIYYSNDGGDTRWQTRTCTLTVQDLAVENAEFIYALEADGDVSKSTNSGFTWGSAKSSKISGNMIVSVGEDKLLVGSQDGYVSYSTDGNSSWTKISKQLEVAAATQVTASGLADGDYIYAATAGADTEVERWELAESTSWKDLSAPTGTNHGAYGIALEAGVLYVVTASTSDSALMRTLNPTASSPTWSTKESAGETFDARPQALRVSTGSTKLWAIDTTEPALYSYSDTLEVTAPTLTSPTHASSVAVNPVTGRAVDVTFTWQKPSAKVTAYQLRIALDEDFDQVVRTIDVDSTSSKVSQIVGPHGDEGVKADVEFMPGSTYYWKVRVSDPIYSPWSVVYAFTVEEAKAPFPEVTVEAPPAPEVTVTPPPAPEVTVTVPPAPAPAPAPPAIPAYLLWTIVGIGAVLIIALIVLIVRTRRVV